MEQAVTMVIRTAIEAGGARFWRPSDFGQLSPRTVDRALCRLAAERELRHIRRGLYWRGHQSPFGMSVPSVEQVAAAIAGEVAVGPAGLSAANMLGLTSQVSPIETMAIPARSPEPLATLRFVDRGGRRARLLERLNAVEVALLEVLADWDEVVEIDASVAQSKIARLFRTGALRPEPLARGAADEPSDVRERLRHVLAAANQREAVGLVAPARTPALQRRALEVFDA